MQSRHKALEMLIVLILGCFVVFTYLVGSIGIWEPWEASTLLVARQLSQTNFTEAAFWVPTLDGELAFRPYIQLWLMAALFRIWPDPGAFLIRLPSALSALWLLLETFCALRCAVSRRVAWIGAGILLTLPTFVFGAKLIQGGIWPILAVSMPILLYIQAVYSETRREARVKRALFAFSLGLSFLAGGLWALAIVILTFVLGLCFASKNPRFDAFTSPFKTRYFLVPLYVVFVFIGLCFGQYVLNSGDVLEKRIGITLPDLNEAIESGRVFKLEKYGKQIRGEFQNYGRERMRFCLADSTDRLNTNARSLLELNEIERKRFEKLVAENFGTLPVQNTRISALDQSFYAALRFFWRNVNHVNEIQNVQLARISDEKLRTDPSLGFIKSSLDEITVGSDIGILGYDGFIGRVHPGEIVQILPQNADNTSHSVNATQYIEIKSSRAEGFVPADILNIIEPKNDIDWADWGRILVLGLFPWIAFWPLIFWAAWAPARLLEFKGEPFHGEFQTQQVKEKISESISPLQWLLFAWLIVSVVALWFGVNFNGFLESTSLIPVTMLLAIILASHTVWKRIMNDGILRAILWICALGVIYACVSVLVQAPFYLVQYMLIDPLMNWPKDYAMLETTIWSYVPIFGVLSLLAFTHIGELRFSRLYLAIANRVASLPTERMNSATLPALSDDIVPASLRPCSIFILAAAVAAAFIYATYLPRISEELTETSLVDHFVSHSGHGEKLYVLNHETERLCATYKDCDTGYVCKDAQCKISTFSSYALSLAQPISRSALLEQISPDAEEKNFFIIPKGVLYEFNQVYRESFPVKKRRNLIVTQAPSSRLYLITNDFEEKSVNPLDQVILDEVPQGVTRVEAALSDDLVLEGFRTDSFSWIDDGELKLTLFYRVENAFMSSLVLTFQVEWAGHKATLEHALDDLTYDSASWLEGDVIADPITIALSGVQTRTSYKITMCVHAPNETCEPNILLTTID